MNSLIYESKVKNVWKKTDFPNDKKIHLIHLGTFSITLLINYYFIDLFSFSQPFTNLLRKCHEIFTKIGCAAGNRPLLLQVLMYI